jgi:7-cyano-7-deazaguanine synthase|tara:strand:- start:1550 stop:2227 length:678 start_codon:yes stop_codon:yes gene_type:complete
MNKRNAVIILSGGMDSVTTLAIAKNEGYECFCITFNYGQKSISEINSAKFYSNKYNSLEHKIFNIDFNDFTESSLITENILVPDKNSSNSIPSTYVPMRNVIFLSIACSWAEQINSSDIFLGANAIDYSGYPDCRDDFISAYEKMINLGSKTGVEGNSFRIHRPLVSMRKKDIVFLGKSLGLDYKKSVSCYQATNDGKACGNCESCDFRKKAFEENGFTDETIYI